MCVCDSLTVHRLGTLRLSFCLYSPKSIFFHDSNCGLVGIGEEINR